MCHLVTWYHVPKSDAERVLLQMDEFFDDPTPDKGAEIKNLTGRQKAMNKAEELIKAGAKDVKLWELVGKPTARTVIEWESSNGND